MRAARGVRDVGGASYRSDMDVLLIPGFWLDGDSWQPVTEALADAGHRPHPLTLPGKAPGESAEGIGLRDHVDAVIAAMDALPQPVVLVGHSGGGSIAWAAADARPAAVARVVFVDALPFPAGGPINDELPIVGDVVPLPDWSLFEPDDLVDLDDALRARFLAMAVPEPARVATDPQQLHDDARFAVPVTILACEFPAAMLHEAIASEAAWGAELRRLHALEIVELPTGHWPQLTRPGELASTVVAAVGAV